MKKTKSQFLASLDAFTQSYIVTALWSSNDNSTPSGGYPLDRKYNSGDIERKTLERMAADCAQFQKENHFNLTVDIDDTRAGFCFWLSRNGHGSGFFDESSLSETVRDHLQANARAFGEFNLDLYRGKISGQ